MMDKQDNPSQPHKCMCCYTNTVCKLLKDIKTPLFNYFTNVKLLATEVAGVDRDAPYVCETCISRASHHIKRDSASKIIENPDDPFPTCKQCHKRANYCGISTCNEIVCCKCEIDSKCDRCDVIVCEDCLDFYPTRNHGTVCETCFDEVCGEDDEDDEDDDGDDGDDGDNEDNQDLSHEERNASSSEYIDDDFKDDSISTKKRKRGSDQEEGVDDKQATKKYKIDS